MALSRFRAKKKKMDFWILFLVFALCVFGLLMIYSSSAVTSFEEFGENNYYFKKQLVSFGIGLVALFVTSIIDYKIWKKYAVWFLAFTIILLLILFAFPEVSGAQRWIQIGPLTFQPSELTKLSFIVYMAAWLAKKKDKISDFKNGFLPFIAILSVIGFLIMKQPDMGTMSVIVAIAVVMFFISGASLWHIGTGFVALAGIGWMLIKAAPYRMQRFLVFLNPSNDSLGAGYHINQALLAIGSGGLWGLGFGQSKQKFLYLPEPHTDSIFAIVVEELGFLRAMLVVAVFIFLVLRGFKIVKNAPDDFSRLLVVGIFTWIIVQFFVNIGAIIGLMPLTGIPLPFVSYGGSSLIVLLAAMGIVLNISKQTNQ